MSGATVAGPDRRAAPATAPGSAVRTGRQPALATLEDVAARVAALLDLGDGPPPALDDEWTTRPDLRSLRSELLAGLEAAVEAAGSVAWVDDWSWLTAPLWAGLGIPASAVVTWDAPAAAAADTARRRGIDPTIGLAWWEVATRGGLLAVEGMPTLCCSVPSPPAHSPPQTVEPGMAGPSAAHDALARYLEDLQGMHEPLHLRAALPAPSGWGEALLRAERRARGAAADSARSAAALAPLQAELAETVAALHWAVDRLQRVEPPPADPPPDAPASLGADLWDEWLDSTAPLAPAGTPTNADTVGADDTAGADDPTVDIVVAVAGDDVDSLSRTVHSVLAQTWPRWSLTLCCSSDDDAGADAIGTVASGLADDRVRAPSRSSSLVAALQEALGSGNGTWVAVIDHGDELTSGVLGEVLALADEDAALDLIYTDEDLMVAGGGAPTRQRKPGWSPVLLGNSPYIGRLWLLRRRVLETAGGVVDGLAWEYDLMLRAVEHTRHIAHLPRAGYLRRAARVVEPPAAPAPLPAATWTKAATDAAVAARHAAAARRDDSVTVVAGPSPATFRIGRALRREPTVRAVIALTTDAGRLQRAVEGLAHVSGVPGVAVTFVDTADPARRDPATAALLGPLLEQPGWHLIGQPGKSWASARNAAADDSDLTLLVDPDLDLTAGGWLRTLVEEILEPGIGAAGACQLSPGGDVASLGLRIGPGRSVGARGSGPKSGWTGVSSDCLALSGCILTWSALLRTFGLDETVGDVWAEADYCLRLRAAGWGVAASAHAQLRSSRPTAPPGRDAIPSDALARRWEALFDGNRPLDTYQLPPSR